MVLRVRSGDCLKTKLAIKQAINGESTQITKTALNRKELLLRPA